MEEKFKKQIPNFLTFFRIVVIPFFILGFYMMEYKNYEIYGYLLIISLFIISSVTDYFDGFLARRWNAMSEFGAMLDPIADKLIISASLVLLVYNQTIFGIHVIAVILILMREILVSGLRDFLAKKNVKLPVTYLAKWKTTIQMVAITILLIAQPILIKIIDKDILKNLNDAGIYALWISAFITIYTGGSYLKQSLKHI